jgi:methylthioribose-1-phosphate isomerase
MIKTVYFQDDSLMLLDQSQLPDKLLYEKCDNPAQVADAIVRLKVRGGAFDWGNSCLRPGPGDK